MTFIDIHSHMDFKDFDDDREHIITEMRKNKIITLSNTLNKENYLYTKELFKNYSDIVKVTPGLYPQDAEKISELELEEYLIFIKKNKNDIVAIGEIGLDKKWTKDEKLFEKQVIVFKKIIELAIKLDKPTIIHTRQAEIEVLQIIEEYKTKYPNYNKYVLHCFCGKKRLINKIKELNIYSSIPLSILNTESFRYLASELAISQILVETDSPFLNPDKTRNSPLNVPLIYSEIAKIKGFDQKEIINIIYKNYMKLTL